MRRRLESQLVIAVYAWFRQAERSIDRTLLSPQLWLPFTIKSRVGSLPALAKAERVENFMQTVFLRHFSLEDLGLISAARQPGTSAA